MAHCPVFWDHFSWVAIAAGGLAASASYCHKWRPDAPHAAAWSEFDAVYEVDALDDVGEMSEAKQFAPAFLGRLFEFEHHVQHAVAAEAPFGPLGPVPDRGEGAFDRV